MFERLVSDNEQDRANCREWWRQATPAAKMLVWDEIQKEHDDPVKEVVTRFAQLAFGEMMESEGK